MFEYLFSIVDNSRDMLNKRFSPHVTFYLRFIFLFKVYKVLSVNHVIVLATLATIIIIGNLMLGEDLSQIVKIVLP